MLSFYFWPSENKRELEQTVNLNEFFPRNKGVSTSNYRSIWLPIQRKSIAELSMNKTKLHCEESVLMIGQLNE